MTRTAELLEPDVERVRERLLNAYQSAVERYGELMRLRVWQVSERREAYAALLLNAEAAEEARDELAAAGAGYIAPARSLLEVLNDVGRHVYGARLDNRGRRRSL